MLRISRLIAAIQKANSQAAAAPLQPAPPPPSASANDDNEKSIAISPEKDTALLDEFFKRCERLSLRVDKE